ELLRGGRRLDDGLEGHPPLERALAEEYRGRDDQREAGRQQPELVGTLGERPPTALVTPALEARENPLLEPVPRRRIRRRRDSRAQVVRQFIIPDQGRAVPVFSHSPLLTAPRIWRKWDLA